MTQTRRYHLYTDLGDILVNLDGYYKKITDSPDANGCLNWLGPWHRQGYGMIGAVRKADDKRIMVVAHRVLGRIKAGRGLASSEAVVHKCSNPKCQNPDHIEIGDLRLRNQTAIANGRMLNNGSEKRAGVFYKQNRKYKYTEDEIRFIRSAPTEEIQKKYNWTRTQVARQRWYVKSIFQWIDKE